MQRTPPSSDIDGNYGAGPALDNYAIIYVSKVINTRGPGPEPLSLLRGEGFLRQLAQGQ